MRLSLNRYPATSALVFTLYIATVVLISSVPATTTFHLLHDAFYLLGPYNCLLCTDAVCCFIRAFSCSLPLLQHLSVYMLKHANASVSFLSHTLFQTCSFNLPKASNYVRVVYVNNAPVCSLFDCIAAAPASIKAFLILTSMHTLLTALRVMCCNESVNTACTSYT
jgi:hypothetical protein